MVKFYNYNNQQIPAKITLLALQKWEKAQELKEGDDYLILFKLALESGHKIENKKLELSDNDVEILFEMYGLEFLDDMTDFFSQVQERMEKITKMVGNPLKKK